MVMTTRAHQLALYVVFDSPLQMLSDSPVAYRGEPGSEFLKLVPTTWDEVKVLDGKIGEYVVIARRHGSDWYVGAITDQPRKLSIPLAFLGPGAFDATGLGRHARVGPGADEGRRHAEASRGGGPDRHAGARPRTDRWRGDPDPARSPRRARGAQVAPRFERTRTAVAVRVRSAPGPSRPWQPTGRAVCPSMHRAAAATTSKAAALVRR